MPFGKSLPSGLVQSRIPAPTRVDDLTVPRTGAIDNLVSCGKGCNDGWRLVPRTRSYRWHLAPITPTLRLRSCVARQKP